MKNYKVVYARGNRRHEVFLRAASQGHAHRTAVMMIARDAGIRGFRRAGPAIELPEASAA